MKGEKDDTVSRKEKDRQDDRQNFLGPLKLIIYYNSYVPWVSWQEHALYHKQEIEVFVLVRHPLQKQQKSKLVKSY